MPSHKEFAHQLRAALAAQGFNIKHSHLLHAVAAMHGLPNWNTLSAQPGAPRLPDRGAWQALANRLAQYGVPSAHLVVQDDRVVIISSPDSDGVVVSGEGAALPASVREASGRRAGGGPRNEGSLPELQAHVEAGGTTESFLTLLSGLETPVERLLPRIDPRRVRVGQCVTLYADGRHAFTVQHILKQGWNFTFITGEGVPVDLWEQDDLYLVE